MKILNRLVPVALLAAVVFFVRAPFMIDGVRYESTMGLIQKIFYFHVPAAITTFVSAFVCGIASVVYLVRRRPLADHVALAAAELAVVFGLIVLVTGPIWARKAWGVWWQWEARLMATLIMWMIFVAYLLLRRFGGAGAEVLAAAVGLFGMRGCSRRSRRCRDRRNQKPAVGTHWTRRWTLRAVLRDFRRTLPRFLLGIVPAHLRS